MMTVDYIVVGGGITGACTAYYLAKRGADVLLVERGELAPDAPISSSGEHAKAFRCIYGADRKMTRLCRESLRRWRQFESEAGVELFVPSGMLVFGADRPETLRRWTQPAHASFATDSATAMQAEGLDYELLTKAEVVERFPALAASPAYDHAILDKTAGYLHARRSVREIGELARRAGAQIWDHTTVEDVVRRGSRVERLLTSRGEVAARRAVVFAAGYMNLVLAPELRAKTRVTQHQILYVKPKDPVPFAPDRFPIVINLNQWRYVFPIHGPGITKVVDDDKFRPGAVIDPRAAWTKEAGDGFRASARSFLEEYIPGLVTAEEIDCSTCRYTNTVDGRYLIYRQGNAVVLSACSGHGFKNAPMTALMAATLAEDPAAATGFNEPDFEYEHADNY